MKNIKTFIIAGGSGTRLWPLSRLSYPKQFSKIIDNKSLLQRALILNNQLSAPIIITHNDYLFLTLEQTREININCQIILEPQGKNTAPCGILAALIAVRDNYDYVILAPADHYINDLKSNYIKNINEAIELAFYDKIAMIGIIPNSPHTGYGYIKVGNKINVNTFEVDEFVEKPDLITATNYINEGNYFWNSGIFIFKPNVLLKTAKELEPEMVNNVKLSLQKAQTEKGVTKLSLREYEDIKPNSFDYAFMENIRNIGAVKAEFEWHEIGSWSGLSEILLKDDNDNNLIGDTYVHDVTNSYISSTNKLAAIIGVKDLIVINNDDTLLVVHKSKTEDIKKVVNDLTKLGRSEALKHNIVYRPWGYYQIIEKSKLFLVKKIRIYPKHKISLQYHTQRAEHWVVVQGVADVQVGEKIHQLSENDSIYVPKGIQHRISNIGEIDLDIIEIQTGSYLEEDDIFRIDDDYGRK